MKKKLGTLLEKIYSSVFGTIISFLVSGGLIGGCGYLLFNYQTNANQLTEKGIQIEQIGNEFGVSCGPCKVYSNGWFTENEHKNPENARLIYSQVLDSLYQTVLEPNFSSNAIDWCNSSVTSLNIERGKIRGYALSNATQKAYQEAMIVVYDEQIVVLTNLHDFIANWKSESPEDKLNYMETINQANSNITAAYQTLMTLTPQILSELEIEKKKLDLTFNESTVIYRTLRIKSGLSIIGIFLGSCLLIISVLEVLKPFTPKPITKKNKENKKGSNTPKGRRM